VQRWLRQDRYVGACAIYADAPIRPLTPSFNLITAILATFHRFGLRNSCTHNPTSATFVPPGAKRGRVFVKSHQAVLEKSDHYRVWGLQLQNIALVQMPNLLKNVD